MFKSLLHRSSNGLFSSVAVDDYHASEAPPQTKALRPEAYI